MTDGQFKAKCNKNKKKKDKLRNFIKSNLKKASRFELYFEAVLKILNVKYEKQYPIHRGDSFYLLDFYIPEHNLCFEIDGKEHLEKQDYDRQRDFYCLNHFAITTHRFTNQEVEKNLAGVMVKTNSLIAEAYKNKELIDAHIEKIVSEKLSKF